MDDYKKEPGSDRKLKERNSKWINNDYIKFLRYAQYHIEKTTHGVIGYINMNSYLDGVIFRGVRWNMLQTYDHQIYILDLHGNSKKKETAPDGGKDENIFDITEGVCKTCLLLYFHSSFTIIVSISTVSSYISLDRKSVV